MSYVESYQERQDNEFQVLQAIFGSDLVDLRKPSVWNTWVPLEVCITLLPQQGSSGLQKNHSQIDLHVKCSSEYPDIEPTITLTNSRGLSNELVKLLQKELEQLATSHKGEVMIFDLTQHVKTFLHKHNCKSEYESFWDEMYGRQEKQKQQILQAQQQKEDKERQEMNNEIQRRKEILRSEPKLKKEQRRTSESDVFVLNPLVERARSFSRKRCQSTSESSDGSQCEHRGTKLLLFTNKGERQVYRGRCVGHSDRGNIFYVGLDLATGEVVAINEWQFKIKQHGSTRDSKLGNLEQHDLSQCMKFIANMEHELNFLTKLRHRNLVNYLNIKYVQENESVIVYLLQEFISGISLASLYLSENTVMDCDMLRYLAEEILIALDFLHKNNVLHRDLRATCVFIDKYGTVKISDYSLDKRLHEFVTRIDGQHKNYSKKNDIYKFGILLLCLLRGSLIDENEKQPKIPVKLPYELKDFLSKCIASDERNRWTTSQLLKHNFIRARIERCSPARTLDTTPSGDGNSGNDSDSNCDIQDDINSCDIQGFIPIQNGGQSRIQNEFEILKWLGRGAFGDVLKVKNRLDGGCYAIKRIRLNPNNKQLNRKITREVKLLSRLNHENVVRYYNSWIESAIVDTSLEDRKTSPETVDEVDLPVKKKNADLKGFVDDMENLCPLNCGVEWSISYESKSKPNPSSPSESSDDETSDDDDDDEWSCFGPATTTVSDSSDGIEFERDSGNVCSENQSLDSSSSTPTKSTDDAKKKNPNSREIQFMYIQMEFCEKSTLRTAIDKGLHQDVDRVWRLFREIVDGLSHIHQQGMIHRDLKPVNIFLDSNDHVKIGDFGLATSNILPKTGLDFRDSNSLDVQLMNSGANGDESLTGKVGTALYVAPELNTKASKAIYNQKVDIYSLGIILFEMAYAPLPTAMERVKVLANLRLKEIVFPPDFTESQYARYVTIIRWLLNHDASQRPTAQELLQSEHVPPPQIEESELQDLLRRTLANTQSKAYKYLIASCFDQDITPAEDITYDMNYPKNTITSDRSLDKPLTLIENVKETVIKIFKLHGGQCLTTPLLLPKSKYYDGIESCVRMMTRSGSIVSIPHDLRVSFARYVARNSITLFKRYSIERVYRERKVFGFQPRELYECAFDIITPTTGNLTAEAELLSIVYELIQEFPTLKSKNFAIRVNHTSLLRAFLLYSGIEQEKHNDIYCILADARDGKLSKFQVQTHLISLCLTDQAMMHVVTLMDSEITLKNASTQLRSLLKRRGEIGDLAKQGLNDLEMIIQNTEALGVKCNIFIAPGLVYNVHQYSGMMCQFVCEIKKKRRRGGMDVLAAGGRYDNMLNSFRSILGRTGMLTKDVQQAGAGISISLDKLVQALQEDQVDSESSIDVLVCAIGSKPMIREKCMILRDLWSAGIRASLTETNNLDDIEEQSRELNITHNIILKESEQGTVLVRSWERDRFQERKVAVNDIVELIQRLMKTSNDNSVDISVQNNILTRSESVLLNTVVRFITTEKLAANTKRRYEHQILSQLNTKLQRLCSRCKVEILAINVESSVIKTMASYIDLEMECSDFNKVISNIIEKHPRHKKYLTKICDYIFELKTEKTENLVIVLYSLIESYYKVIL